MRFTNRRRLFIIREKANPESVPSAWQQLSPGFEPQQLRTGKGGVKTSG
jgi:hypothetical protein